MAGRPTQEPITLHPVCVNHLQLSGLEMFHACAQRKRRRIGRHVVHEKIKTKRINFKLKCHMWRHCRAFQFFPTQIKLVATVSDGYQLQKQYFVTVLLMCQWRRGRQNLFIVTYNHQTWSSSLRSCGPSRGVIHHWSGRCFNTALYLNLYQRPSSDAREHL